MLHSRCLELVCPHAREGARRLAIMDVEKKEERKREGHW